MPLIDGEVCLSYSAFSDYKKCPYRYFLGKIKREKVPHNKTFTVPGLILHKAAEDFINTSSRAGFLKESIEHEVSVFSSDPDINIEETYGDSGKFIDQLILSGSFLEGFIVTEKLSSKSLVSEQKFGHYTGTPFKVTEDCYIQGSADLLALKDSNTAILYDYKYTYSTKYLDVDQLILYSVALEELLHVKINLAGFFLIPLKRQIFYNISDFDKENLKRRLQDAAVNIKKGNFPKTSNKENCKFCPFNTVCNSNTSEKEPLEEVLEVSLDSFSF